MASPYSVHGFAGAVAAPAGEARGATSGSSAIARGATLPEFKRVYDEHVAFMYRAARHLGVAPSAIEDVLQEVFIVVHRRLGEFEGRSTMKTWMYGILLHVVRNHRRSLRRRGVEAAPATLDLAATSAAGPHESAETAEAMRTLEALLGELDDARREVFVLAELEQLTVPEIAELVGDKPNTIYGRLRNARQQFETALRRHHAKSARRSP